MYTEEQLRKQVLEAFRIGLAIGEKRAARSEEPGRGGYPPPEPRLTLIRGGAA